MPGPIGNKREVGVVMNFLDSRVLVPALVIVYARILWVLTTWYLGPQEISKDLVAMAFFLSLSAGLWVLDVSSDTAGEE